jgi:hypothetical protein
MKFKFKGRLQRSASSVSAPSQIFKRLLSFRRSKSITGVDNNNVSTAVNNNINKNLNTVGPVQIIKTISDLNEVLKYPTMTTTTTTRGKTRR